ncbi:MAG: sigma-70 family RNA polymerase sigma factor [Clostridium paraputrificum]|nr:sigma-70 family RNA polymerase sigma factor [Clostridium paraputrificum]MDY4723232.1 sigma-70 family RNA polymerase sigma factor [Clostridium paraputrificum]
MIGSRKDKENRNAKRAIPLSLLILEREEDKDIHFEISIEDTTLNNIIENLDVRQAMNNLPDIERKVLVKRYWEEKTQRVISNELGVSQAEISRKLRKALNSISSYINTGGIAN